MSVGGYLEESGRLRPLDIESSPRIWDRRIRDICVEYSFRVLSGGSWSSRSPTARRRLTAHGRFSPGMPGWPSAGQAYSLQGLTRWSLACNEPFCRLTGTYLYNLLCRVQQDGMFIR